MWCFQQIVRNSAIGKTQMSINLQHICKIMPQIPCTQRKFAKHGHTSRVEDRKPQTQASTIVHIIYLDTHRVVS